jgi:hypothetical protein
MIALRTLSQTFQKSIKLPNAIDILEDLLVAFKNRRSLLLFFVGSNGLKNQELET